MAKASGRGRWCFTRDQGALREHRQADTWAGKMHTLPQSALHCKLTAAVMPLWVPGSTTSSRPAAEVGTQSGGTAQATQAAAPPDRHRGSLWPTPSHAGHRGCRASGPVLCPPVQFGPSCVGSSFPSPVGRASDRAGREALGAHVVFFSEACERLSMS